MLLKKATLATTIAIRPHLTVTTSTPSTTYPLDLYHAHEPPSEHHWEFRWKLEQTHLASRVANSGRGKRGALLRESQIDHA